MMVALGQFSSIHREAGLAPGIAAVRLEVAAVSHSPVILHGVKAMLAPFSERVRVSARPVRAVRRARADVTLLDTDQGMLDVVNLLADPGNGRVLIYARNFSAAQIGEALIAGCVGYVDYRASADQLMDALEDAAAPQSTGRPRTSPARGGSGPDGLTPREAEVIALIGVGLSNQDICDRMHVSMNTLKTYIRTAYRKIGVTRRVDAVRWSIEHDILATSERHLG